ncbi:MAG: aldehyde dehydrogenase family protein, partial [Caulobacteraceae bacterium]
MREALKFYIDGEWVDPVTPRALDVIDPATEEVCGRISLGSAADVDKAVTAARRAFETFSRTTREERLDLLNRIIAAYDARIPEMAETITLEMGAPSWLAQRAQAALGSAHFRTAVEVLKTYAFEELKGTTLIAREAIGVCGFITPWNWPINQIAAKVAPALATGCTVILKPSEVAPLNAVLFAEILDEAGVPPGVFNLINGDGPGVGEAL